MSAAAYRQLERLIVFQDLAPGTLASESGLMEATGLGRTPIREALQRLARDGLVEIFPNKGVLIPPLSVEAELRTLELRKVLEVLAVRLCCVRATDQERDEMRSMIKLIDQSATSLEDYMDTVRGTHELIARASHNPYLVKAMAPLQALSRRFWLAHVRDVRREISTGAHIHVEILEGVIANNPLAAAKASEALNHYLVEFSQRTVGELGGRRR